jgi:hypothetical protein
LIVWQGRGGVTALIIILSMIIVLVLVNVTGRHGPDWATYFAMAVPAAAANSPSDERVVIDKATGREFTLSSRHTLFWIPIKYWTFIILVYPVVGTLRDLK